MHHMHAQLKVHICAPYTHTCTTKHMCTTKYHQNIRYTQLAFPLYSMKHQVQMRDLCWTSCFWCFSLCFSLFRWKPQYFSWKLQCFSWKLQCFSQKPPLFMKTATVFIVSFWVITKYRSFVRKTKQPSFVALHLGCYPCVSFTGHVHVWCCLVSTGVSMQISEVFYSNSWLIWQTTNDTIDAQ